MSTWHHKSQDSELNIQRSMAMMAMWPFCDWSVLVKRRTFCLSLGLFPPEGFSSFPGPLRFIEMASLPWPMGPLAGLPTEALGFPLLSLESLESAFFSCLTFALSPTLGKRLDFLERSWLSDQVRHVFKVTVTVKLIAWPTEINCYGLTNEAFWSFCEQSLLVRSTNRQKSTVLPTFCTFPSSSFRRRNAAAWKAAQKASCLGSGTKESQTKESQDAFVVYFIWSNVYCSVFRSTSVTPASEHDAEELNVKRG